ncbi:MAG: AI-2E family transporter [Kofleriaceae bacterium]
MSDRAVRTEDERRVVQLLRWLLIVIFIALGYITLKYVAAVMAPLIAAFAIAYLLQPVLEILTARGLSRAVSAAALLIGFLGAIVIAVITAAPLIADQLGDFINNLPKILHNFNTWVHATFGVTLPEDWTAFLTGPEVKDMASGATGPLRQFASAALGSVFGFLAVLGESLLIPVFAFYFLADWSGVLAKLLSIVPPRRRALVSELVTEVDEVVSGWVRGQAIVTVILAILYALAFSIVRMPLAVSIGLVVGALTVIPFVGTVVGAGLALTIAVAAAPAGMAASLALKVAAIIGGLHLLEAGVLTPKIVGHRVGLSESAALFAVLAGGKLLGFVGVVLAVPLAATAGVLVRHGIRVYEHSSFFGDESDAQVVIPPAMEAVLPRATPRPASTAAPAAPEEPEEPEAGSSTSSARSETFPDVRKDDDQA